VARPLKYENADDMQALIHLYFEGCKLNRVALAEGLSKPVREVLTEDLHPTITGLALVLDLSRQGLINYEGKEEFVDTVREAKQRVESYLEQRLYSGNVAGCVFNLKNNFQWKDRTEVEHDGKFNHNHGGQGKRVNEILQEFLESHVSKKDRGNA